ncbi:uncharacterized protein EI90DRAFT_3029553 [Cantharellus anzutake]|uniref:uncharacterized protein n=1 Tax=Cantharellus anzutake TaxID=1750568 RepID=UPI0019078339|nr:uncharacterized protein EI90DRAFT_3029553 [Cantharellus anzutake]KAF8342601.1 hypothetical protein EI90DRAFT_3029553 [Cantharellus anzutake]
MNQPAILFVMMETGAKVTEQEFHEWYSEEHVPLRVNKFPSFRTAARYRAIDGATPKWMAMYTIEDISIFSDPEYTILREQRSPREADIVARLAALDRRIYSLISDTNPMPDALRPSSIASNIVVTNSFTPAPGTEEKFHKWYEEEYIHALKQIPGWARTRRYKLEDRSLTGLESSELAKDIPQFLEVSEFDALSVLRNAKFPSETFGSDIVGNSVQSERRVFKLLKGYEPIAAFRSIKTPGSFTPGWNPSGFTFTA